MSSKPSCFTKYCPMRTSPCQRCAWRGPCSMRSAVGGFSFLPFPRYPMRTKSIRTYDGVEQDDGMAERILSDISISGFRRQGASLLEPPRRCFCRVTALPGRAVRIEFPQVSKYRLLEMSASAHCQIIKRMVRVKNKKIGYDAKMKSLRRHVMLRERGSIAICFSEADARALIIETARQTQ